MATVPLEEQLALEAEMDVSGAILEARDRYKEAPDSDDRKFAYAWALSKSTNRDEITAGIKLLRQLIDAGHLPSDCLYYIALAHYRLGQYAEARRHVERLLRTDPDNARAARLHQLVKDKVAKDGLLGLGIALAGAAALGMVVKAALKRR